MKIAANTFYLFLGDGLIGLNIKLGLALVPLKSKIEKTIKHNVSVEMSDNRDPKSA